MVVHKDPARYPLAPAITADPVIERDIPPTPNINRHAIGRRMTPIRLDLHVSDGSSLIVRGSSASLLQTNLGAAEVGIIPNHPRKAFEKARPDPGLRRRW